MSDTNYNEIAVVGTSWQRAVGVFIHNPLNETPRLIFEEERVITTELGTTKQKLGQLSVMFDPTNADHTALYTLLNAEYIKARTLRDTPKPPPVEPVEIVPQF